ncbi:hypothetical protein L4C36_23545, partial [Photobacterium japonica]|uniref:hypothetical protein n=1 Tax=Photobacterium japonica TaxID=2910235 RepID=UPI003D0B28EF
MKNYDYVLVEPKCCAGHVELYKELIKTRFNDGSVLFISSSNYLDKIDIPNVDKYEIKLINSSNKVFY